MTYAAEVLENATSLRRWWRLGGSGSTLSDASGYGNAGSVHGGAGQGASGPLDGEASAAVYLDGAASTFTAAQFLTAPAIELGDGLTGRGPGPFGDTWECWFRADADTFSRSGRRYGVFFQVRQMPVVTLGVGNLLVRVSYDATGSGVWGLSLGPALSGVASSYFVISRPLTDWTAHLDCWRLVTLVRRTGSYLGVPVAEPGWHLYLDDVEVGYTSAFTNLNITSGCVFNVGGDEPDADRGTVLEEWELFKGHIAEPAYYVGQHSLVDEIIPRFSYRRPCGVDGGGWSIGVVE